MANNCKKCGRFQSKGDQTIGDGYCNKCRLLISGQSQPHQPQKLKEEINMKWYQIVLIAVAAVVLALVGYSYIDGQNDRIAQLETTANQTKTASANKTPQTVYINNDETGNSYTVTGGNTTDGIDQPSKSWFIAKKGSMISGDVAIFDNDNNSRKLPIYDGASETTDIVIVGQDGLYIWTEWGCHYWESPTQQDISDEIANKLSEGFTSVRKFDGLTRQNHKNLDPAVYSVTK